MNLRRLSARRLSALVLAGMVVMQPVTPALLSAQNQQDQSQSKDSKESKDKKKGQSKDLEAIGEREAQLVVPGLVDEGCRGLGDDLAEFAGLVLVEHFFPRRPVLVVGGLGEGERRQGEADRCDAGAVIRHGGGEA